MELATSPMTEKQRAYRSTYRSRIDGWYNGVLHVAIIYSIAGLALWYYSQHIQSVQWWEWTIVPLTFAACNIFEWFLHKHVMHRPINLPGLRAVYERHTLQHHQFFTEKEMRFADSGDWRVTFFPPYALVIFIMMSAPGVLVLSWLISPNVGWLFISTTTAMYILYEFMHFCCHVEDNAFVRHMPFVNTLRRHHTAHHDKSIMMQRNMNLTFPIADWLFGTSDLNRGLLGHIFNGYSEKHVKSDMSPDASDDVRLSTPAE
jgi:hypothetical protein